MEDVLNLSPSTTVVIERITNSGNRCSLKETFMVDTPSSQHMI
jgi:hypothetical protein